MRAALACLVVAACGMALPACHVLEPEGRRQTATFTTPLTVQQTRARAEDWLSSRALYALTSSGAGFVRGEKRRPRTVGPGDQIDVVSATFADVPEGTEVELEALTFELAGSGARALADQVSPEAIRDIDELARVLMTRP
jgi:hypothetical protein